MKKLFIALGIILGSTAIWLQWSGNTHVYKTLAMTIFRGQMGPDIDDIKDFPLRAIPNLNPASWPKSSQ